MEVYSIDTKRRNSCNTNPSAPIFLLHVHCLMVKVLCKFEQNWTKAIKVIEQKPYLLTELQNQRMADMLKTIYPTKTSFAGSIKKACAQQWLRSVWASHWAHVEDFDQTGRTPRMIWVFAGRTHHFVGFVMLRFNIITPTSFSSSPSFSVITENSSSSMKAWWWMEDKEWNRETYL